MAAALAEVDRRTREKEERARQIYEAQQEQRQLAEAERLAEQLAAQERLDGERAEAENERREAEAAAAAQQDLERKLDEAVRRDRQEMRIILSLNICDATRQERMALGAIKHEKANAQIAGVVDPGLLRTYQNNVVRERQRRALLVRMLAGTKSYPCGHKALDAVLRCAAAPGSATVCAEARMQARVRVLNALVDGATSAP